MRASLCFRVAAILITLFAVGHTLGFRQTDPSWGLEPTITSMKTIHFSTQGFKRTYWDFFAGFGFFVTVFLFVAAVFAWQLGSLSDPSLGSMRLSAWALTLGFGAVVVLSWRYFFLVPVIFSALIFLLLLAGTLISQQLD